MKDELLAFINKFSKRSGYSPNRSDRHGRPRLPEGSGGVTEGAGVELYQAGSETR